ncbi:MAG: SH3 domain-containing protein [Chloroflexi bacterium]|nr:SH3 domain-containing protein [Chloroflexota bacterium]
MKEKLFFGKKWFIVLLLMVGLFMTSQVLAIESEAQVSAPATVNTGALNVRSGPGSEYGVVDVVYQNNVVTMLGRNADASWIYIRTPNNIEGWVNEDFLTYTINIFDLPAIGAPSTTATPTPTYTPTPGSTPVTPVPGTAVVNTGALNVRSGPGVQYGILTAIYQGEVVLLVARNADGSWVLIRTDDLIDGWVNSRYLLPSIPIANLPAIGEPGPTPVNPIAPTPTATGIPGAASITAAHLNVRNGPGVSYPRVGSVDYGNVVSLLGRNLDSSWVIIASAGAQQGWVNSKYVATNLNVGALPVSSQTGTGHVATGNLNVRFAPGAGSTVVTVASYGQALTLLGRTSDNSWLKVRAPNGKEGWVNASYVATGLDLNALPSLAGPVPGQPAIPPPANLPSVPSNPANTASIRTCPNLSCPASGSVYSGLTVTATGRTADSSWVYVVLSNGQQGWIQSQFVQLGVPISSLPVVTSSPSG